MSRGQESPAPSELTHLGKLGTNVFYPIRVVTVLGGLLVGFLYTFHFGEFGPYGYVVAFIGAVYPHVMYFLQLRFESKRRIAHLTLLFDAAFAGAVIYLLSFSFQASLTMALIALVTPIAFTGFSLLPWTSLALASGILLPIWMLGMPPPAQTYPLLDFIAGGYVLAFFALFANAVFVRTRALQGSRKELRDQQLRTEIEKKRSEGLLESIVPPIAVAELHQSGQISAQRRSCAICVVAIPGLARPPSGSPDAAIIESATDILGSIDAICARFKLEAVNSTFDLHVAVGSLDGSTATIDDATRASEEITAWFANFNQRRVARGEEPLAYGIAIGFGELMLGAIQLRHFLFAVSGAALFDTIAVARNAVQLSGALKSG